MDKDQVALAVFATLVGQYGEGDEQLIENLANKAHDIADVFVKVTKSRKPLASATVKPLNI